MSTNWGKLTGVRPVKIVHYLFQKGYNEAEIFKILLEEHLLNEISANLIIEIAKHERNLLKSIAMNQQVAVYVNIPFCPTRCSYCSFVAAANRNDESLKQTYLNALIIEIKALREMLTKNNIKVGMIYIGGGTPTTLNADQLTILLAELQYLFHDKLLEYTVEAGRPDTITDEKLQVFNKFGVDRISINPQTMNANTLLKVNRQHTPQQIIEAVALARNYNFIINMDMIIGLPNEKLKDMVNTLENLIALKPENITVHNLALKRAATINIEQQAKGLPNVQLVKEMNTISSETLSKHNYTPYYLYRQKNTIGGHPNIGYTKANYACLYNIAMISEQVSIYGCGAGAVTKILDSTGHFVRLAAPKDAEVYISQIDKNIEKKKRWLRNAH